MSIIFCIQAPALPPGLTLNSIEGKAQGPRPVHAMAAISGAFNLIPSLAATSPGVSFDPAKKGPVAGHRCPLRAPVAGFGPGP